jgi:LacI family transcriptional regulator
MATLQDVAKKAGVAPITVSRVVNNSGYVAQEVRERVEAAVEELGYVPNILARSLRSRQTNTLALVLSDVTNPFFTTVARGAGDSAAEAGFMLILCNTDEREQEEQRYLKMLVQRRVDGVLLVPAGKAVRQIQQLRQHGTQVVVLDRRLSEPVADVVRGDSLGGSRALCRHLVQQGHRVSAVLTGPKQVSTSRDRVQGFREAMAEAGLETMCRAFYGQYSQSSGYAMAGEALNQTPRPTALFATNNFIAIGALNCLRDRGVKVPEDVALVAFDDLPPGLVTFPFLTVVSQPAYEMGRKGAELLLRRLNGDAEPYQEVVLPVEMTLRRSSGSFGTQPESMIGDASPPLVERL